MLVARDLSGWFDANYLFEKQRWRLSNETALGVNGVNNNRDFPNSGILFRNDRKDGEREPRL
jgi:hypothetical protein